MAARLFRLDLLWNIASNAERAQIGLWFLSPSGETQGAVGVALTPLIDTWWSSQDNLHSSTITFANARLNTVTVNTGVVTAGEDLPIAGGIGQAGGNALPPEVALVVSLRTGFSSPRMRGRVYLPPMPSSSLTSAGNVDVSFKTGSADNMAAFLSAVKTSVATDCEPVVYSRVDRSTTTISSVRCGQVFDVHRSRRRSLVEAYYSAAV